MQFFLGIFLKNKSQHPLPALPWHTGKPLRSADQPQDRERGLGICICAGMFMYEETQGRMGKMFWENTEGDIKNFPIFYADKIQTPLLIYHCDADEAVPYSEGLNLFLAMRRLQKPAWLLNYKGERHFLYNDAARLDWTIRLKQFFDHYLRGTAMPRWMKEGIRVNERGIDQKYDLVE